MSWGKEREKERRGEVVTLKQEYKDQLKISDRCPDSPAESTDKIYPSTQKQRLSSCRDLSVPSVEHASRSHCRGRRASPTAAAEPRGSWAAEGRSVLHGQSLPPCSSKQKGSEEEGKLSCRRQIFLFVKYCSFSICISSVVTSWWKPQGPCYNHRSMADVLWFRPVF